jgi:hypothetical protein
MKWNALQIYLCLVHSISSPPMLMQHMHLHFISSNVDAIHTPTWSTMIWSTSYHHVTILIHRSWLHLLFTVASVYRRQVLLKPHRHTWSLDITRVKMKIKFTRLWVEWHVLAFYAHISFHVSIISFVLCQQSHIGLVLIVYPCTLKRVHSNVSYNLIKISMDHASQLLTRTSHQFKTPFTARF